MKEHRTESINLLHGVFDVFHEPLVVTDPGGNVLSANNSMEELTGYSKHELQDNFLPHLVHHEECKPPPSDSANSWLYLYRIHWKTDQRDPCQQKWHDSAGEDLCEKD